MLQNEDKKITVNSGVTFETFQIYGSIQSIHEIIISSTVSVGVTVIQYGNKKFFDATIFFLSDGNIFVSLIFLKSDDAVNPDRMFDLVAVVVHCGSTPNRGHYITVVKSHGFWLLFDDDIVDVHKNINFFIRLINFNFPFFFSENRSGQY